MITSDVHDVSETANSKQNKSSLRNNQDMELETDEPLVREDSHRILWRTVNPHYYQQDLLEVQVSCYLLSDSVLYHWYWCTTKIITI